MTDQAVLHRKLLDMMAASGSLPSPEWRRAAETVPRHEFLRGGYFRPVPGSAPTAWEAVHEGDPGWLAGCYADESLVTQIADTVVPADIRGQIMQPPSSSSTVPSLVLRMLEDAHVEPDSRVLEIGTGTGYSTAVMCARLGEDAVTSIEYDEQVATRARAALGQVGMFPTLVVGDGLLGHAERAPYDRIIATCGVREVPAAWLEQTRPGGLILATVGGWLGASELARLTVHEDGTASGPFLGGGVSFMLARPHLPPPLGLLPDLSEGTERGTSVVANALDDWVIRFLVQDVAPRAQRLTLDRDGVSEDVLIDVELGAWAALHREAGRWVVRQGGPAALWDAVEDQLAHWRADGAPEVDELTVHVGPQGQSIRW
ncbi:ATP-grasp peptide maturase system methyltransferase [Streptomyces sp. NPDC088810]|uniref:ATP-grasp peptide maturase system methyltransferase n=1 Tax=Streptomyces sp. NPDC088810 TaxID=3365904 RepID=UPI003820DA5F